MKKNSRKSGQLVGPRSAGALAVAGLALLLLNGYGLSQTLRPSALHDASSPLCAGTGFRSLKPAEFKEIAGCDPDEMLVRINELARQTIWHMQPETLHSAGIEDGDEVDLLHLRVPIWENFVLYGLSYLKPDTYERYEFCDYRRAFERGIGACGQKALAVVSYLHEHGFESGFIDWRDHHAVALARLGEREWWVLDPEYGITFPYPVEPPVLRDGPPLPAVSRALLTARPDLRTIRHPDGWMQLAALDLYPSSGQTVRLGGPAARWGRAHLVERFAYVVKWLLPALLLLPFALHLARKVRRPVRLQYASSSSRASR